MSGRIRAPLSHPSAPRSSRTWATDRCSLLLIVIPSPLVLGRNARDQPRREALSAACRSSTVAALLYLPAVSDLCISNRHLRGVPILFGYETTGKPRGTGAPAATRRRPRQGGRLDHRGCPAARMFPQFGHPVAGCCRATSPRGPAGATVPRTPAQR